MIVRLNKAVLHVLDLDSAVSVLSKAELDLEEKPVKSYVQSICRKALGSTDCRHGNFGTDNALATKVSRYLHGADEFVSLTAEMAGFVFGEIQRADGAKSTDMPLPTSWTAMIRATWVFSCLRARRPSCTT